MIIDVEYTTVKKATRKPLHKDIKKEGIKSIVHIIRALKWLCVALIGSITIAFIFGLIKGLMMV